MYCAYCGQQIPSNGRFCPKCGKQGENIVDDMSTFQLNVDIATTPSNKVDNLSKTKENIAAELLNTPFMDYLSWVFVGAICSIIISILVEGTSRSEQEHFFRNTNLIGFYIINYFAVIIPISCIVMYFLGHKKDLLKTAAYGLSTTIILTIVAILLRWLFNANSFLTLYLPELLQCLGICVILALSVGDRDSVKKLAVAGILVGIIVAIVNTILVLIVQGAFQHERDIAMLSRRTPTDIAIWFDYLRRFIVRFMIFGIIPVSYKFAQKYIFHE